MQLHPTISSFSFNFGTEYIDRVQIRLQDPTINFREAACDINGLRDVLKQECDGVNGIEELIIEGKDLAEAMGVEEPPCAQNSRHAPAPQLYQVYLNHIH